MLNYGSIMFGMGDLMNQQARQFAGVEYVLQIYKNSKT